MIESLVEKFKSFAKFLQNNFVRSYKKRHCLTLTLTRFINARRKTHEEKTQMGKQGGFRMQQNETNVS